MDPLTINATSPGNARLLADLLRQAAAAIESRCFVHESGAMTIARGEGVRITITADLTLALKFEGPF